MAISDALPLEAAVPQSSSALITRHIMHQQPTKF